MHILHALASLAVCSALALPSQAGVLKNQDMMTMQEAFDHIFTQLDGMTTSLKSNTADQAGISQFVSENTKLREVLKVGTDKVKSSPAIAFVDLINIGGPLFVMEDKVSDFVQVLKSKKQALDQAGGSQAVLEELKQDRKAVDALVGAIGQNLPFPGLLSAIAGPIGNLIVGKLDTTIKEWSTK